MIEAQGSTPPGRIASLDAVRGLAVLGILLMNIVAMGMPAFAYLDPTFYGTEGPADWTAWAINFVFSDGKMRGLFSMLFGASMVLLAERTEAAGENPAAAHYKRMFWLLVFGMVHAWLIWFGDILVQYAVAGAIAYLMWRWDRAALWVAFAAMSGLQLVEYWNDYHLTLAFPGLPAGEEARIAAREIVLYRGGFADAFAARAPMTSYFQTELIPQSITETLGYMALGIILYRTGFLTGGWSKRAYMRMLALGYLIAAPLHVPLAWLLAENDFHPATVAITDAAGVVLRPLVALAHASAVILLLRSGRLRGLTSRIEASGRMAFSNYLGTSIVATTIFYGYGLGLFGQMSRAELYIVVAAIWALILLWSKPWLERFRYGPLEWLWRSLARGRVQPMRRESA